MRGWGTLSEKRASDGLKGNHCFALALVEEDKNKWGQFSAIFAKFRQKWRFS
jgi:hypothetical protein